ncbi:MAG TPA: gamma-glutamyltransferase [Alphaproteobacteria bacterium]|nr:gamma-glutamyltransferase [Alphaproteobacteria bacterium]
MSGKGQGIVGLGREGTYRHVLLGNRHMASAAHFAAAHAAFLVLEAGGNAIDAGVAAGFMLGVVQSDIVNVAGVAPIMLYLAETREVLTIDGLGVWPAAASIEHFAKAHGGKIPEGLLRTVTPAAPASWLAALERYGTMSFGEVASAAIRLAREGFPMHPPMADYIARNVPRYERWPQNAAIYLPHGRAPAAGELFVQSDLGASLQYMADEETAAKKRGRVAGITAARDAFYRGDIAQRIAGYHREHGGWLTEADLAAYQVRFEPPARCRFGEVELYTCGPWCQGPVLAESLNILKGVDLAGLGHNSPAYVHLLTEAMKLAFADREAYFGDPRFVDVPLETLLSERYAAERRAEIDPARAAPGMPPAGRAWPDRAARHLELVATADAGDGTPRTAHDTSYVAVIDRHGNVFSATPSDSSSDGEVIPGTGLCPSTRGCQSRTDPSHPSALQPGKRPRLTPNPAIAFFGERAVMPFGTPGGDVQSQAMLQVLLNVAVFGMDLQAAVEAPRFASFSFPNSFAPHDYYPARLTLEARVPAATAKALSALGHDVQPWPEFSWNAGAVCAVARDNSSGVLTAGADPRRSSYAVGW